jgi:peptidoglycan hydrolase CwlO-like protein
MRKQLFAVLCVLTIFASTAPIFAADTTKTPTPVVLTPDQIAKLDALQTKLTNLVAKIEGLKTTYKSTKKTKGLLTALNQYKKQANKLNTAITNYKNHPTANAANKIKALEFKTKQLQWKVAVTEKILKKVTTKKPIKKPVSPVKPVKKPVCPVKNTTTSTL